MQEDKLKYPICRFKKPKTISNQILLNWILDITNFPTKLSAEVSHLTDEQLNTQYRSNCWTIRQVIHHCADSHSNSLIRVKLTLTEDKPIIKPYFEERWAELIDSKYSPIKASLKIFEGIHERWAILLNNLTSSDLEKTFIHPERGKEFRIDENIGIYAWHCNHHLAHITTLKQGKGWK